MIKPQRRRLLLSLTALGYLGNSLSGLFNSAYAATTPEAGKEYTLISPPKPTQTAKGKVEVIEFFSYLCPHCADFEPDLKAWLKNTPHATIRRVPVGFGRNQWQVYQRIYLALEALGKTAALHEQIFLQVHVKGAVWRDAQAAADFMVTQGIDKQSFLDAYQSFSMDAQLRQADKTATEWGIDGVPSLGIAGKYLTGAGQAGSKAQLLEVATYLVTKEGTPNKQAKKSAT